MKKKKFLEKIKKKCHTSNLYKYPGSEFIKYGHHKLALGTSTNPFNEEVAVLLATNLPALSLTLTTATIFELVFDDASISKFMRPIKKILKYLYL